MDTDHSTLSPQTPAESLAEWRGKFSFFDGSQFAVVPVAQRELSWAELSDLLHAAGAVAPGRDKAMAGFFIACGLKGGVHPRTGQVVDGYRNVEHVQSVSCAVVDYDELPDREPNWGPEVWPSAGLAYSSHRWAPTADEDGPGTGPGRWRVVLPLSRSISARDYNRIRKLIQRRLPGGTVVGSRACCQPAYLPSCPEHRQVQYHSWDAGAGGRATLDVDLLLAEADAAKHQRAAAEQWRPPLRDRAPKRRHLSTSVGNSSRAKILPGGWVCSTAEDGHVPEEGTTGRWAPRIAAALLPGKKERAMYALGGGLARAGVRRTWAESFVRAVLLCRTDVDDIDHGIAQVDRAYDGLFGTSDGESTVCGWPVLVHECLGAVGSVTPQELVRGLTADVEDPRIAREREEIERVTLELQRTTLDPTGPDGDDLIVQDPRPDAVPDDAEQLMHAERILAKCPRVFKANGMLVHVREQNVIAGARWEDEDGVPHPVVVRGLGAMNDVNVQMSLCRAPERFWKGTWSKKANGGAGGVVWRQVSPPESLCKKLIRKGEWPQVNPCFGIVTAPCLLPDGSVLQSAEGYSENSGWYYSPADGARWVAVRDESCSLDDAQAALERLREPFLDFPWADPQDADLAVALVLSGLARPAIGGDVPAFLFDASTPGSGKTLVVDVCDTIVHGQVAAKCTWPSTEEEREKVLGGVGIAATPRLAFDNLNSEDGRGAAGGFGGATIDKVLSCGGRIKLRVLGKSENPEINWRTVITATGNNLVVRGDTIRRCLMVRLEPQCERPEDRPLSGFRHADLLGWAQEHRASLVAAGLTILRGYVLAGEPLSGPEAVRDGAPSFGGYADWCRRVACALRWAGGADVTTARTRVEADPQAEQVMRLYEALGEFCNRTPEGATARDILTWAYGPESQDHESAAGVAREVFETNLSVGYGKTMPTPFQLAKWLGPHRGRVRSGLKLETRKIKKVNRWVLTKLKS